MSALDDYIVNMLSGRGSYTNGTASTAGTTTAAEILAGLRLFEHLWRFAEMGCQQPPDPDTKHRRLGLEQFCDAVVPGGLRPYQRDFLRVLSMPVHESLMAVSVRPVRVHKKRRNQSDAYHRRVQKKWTKRFGMTKVPAAYCMDAGLVGVGHGKVLVCHPQIAAQLRREAGSV